MVHYIMDMPHDARVTIVAVEHGAEWAWLSVAPMTDTARSIFPLMPGGPVGDTRKRSEAGVILSNYASVDARHAAGVVVQRAAKMFKKYGI